MEKFIFRNAGIDDIPFLVSTIIEAEKSGTDTLSYSEIFGLSEEDTRDYLSKMFLEEIDGCELSVSAYLLAEKNGATVASVSAWVEGSEGISSTVLKGNLLSYILPKKCIERAVAFAPLLGTLNIEYIPGSIQIGVVFVTEEGRGKGLANTLINQQVIRLKENNPAVSEAYVQVFSNNIPAISAYKKAGFFVQGTKASPDTTILKLLPSDKKILMKKIL